VGKHSTAKKAKGDDSMPGEQKDDRFAEYLDSLRGLLKINRQRRNQIEDELRDHVEERVGELTARGMESEAATALALSEFGDAATLAADFSQVTRHSKRNQIMRLCTTTAAIALILFMGFSMLHPNGQTEGTAQLALPPVTQQVETPAPSTSPASLSVNQDERNEATRELLSETSVDLDLIEMPVADCLNFLKEECECMQWYASASASGYAPHSADNSGPYGDYDQSASYMGMNISITLSDIPAEMALRLVLDQAGLGYYLDNGVVIVTDIATAAARLDIRVYDISGLIAAVKTNPNAGTAYSPQTTYYAPNSNPEHTSQYNQYQPSKDVASQIIQLVLSVGPDTWDEVGGPGSVNVFQNALVVRQTEEVHLQLEEFLKVVESVVSNNAPRIAPPPSPVTYYHPTKGEILSIQSDGKIEISLGQNDGLQPNQELQVSRQEDDDPVCLFIGKIKVLMVTLDKAICVNVSPNTAEYQSGDQVMRIVSPQLPVPSTPTPSYTGPTPQHPPQTPTAVPPTPYRQTPYPADQQPQRSNPTTPTYAPRPSSRTSPTPQTPTPPQPTVPQTTPNQAPSGYAPTPTYQPAPTQVVPQPGPSLHSADSPPPSTPPLDSNLNIGNLSPHGRWNPLTWGTRQTESVEGDIPQTPSTGASEPSSISSPDLLPPRDPSEGEPIPATQPEPDSQADEDANEEDKDEPEEE
jgi:hypothetical protein